MSRVRKKSEFIVPIKGDAALALEYWKKYVLNPGNDKGEKFKR